MRISVQDMSSWVLRTGVLVSAATMLAGLVLAFAQGELPRARFTPFDPTFAAFLAGLSQAHGLEVTELGVYLLVLTPIARVFMSMVLFRWSERDRLYSAITLTVLVLTLFGLLFLK